MHLVAVCSKAHLAMVAKVRLGLIQVPAQPKPYHMFYNRSIMFIREQLTTIASLSLQDATPTVRCCYSAAAA